MSTTESVRTAFKTRAVIDWIDLTVTLKSGTQFRYIQAKLRSILGITTNPWVEAVNAGAGNVATCFTVRLHDAHASTLRDLEQVMASLALAFPFAETPKVTGIEIALDFYSRQSPSAIPGLV